MKRKKIALFLLLLWGVVFCLLGQELSLIKIDEEEINLELDRIIKQNRLGGKEFKEEEIPLLRENIKEGIIMRKLLVSLAVYREITVSDDDVNASLAETKKNFTPHEWLTLLSQQGYTEDSFRMVLEESLLIDLVLENEVLKYITVSDKEVETYYEEHSEDFTTDHGVIPLREVDELIKQNLLTLKGQQKVSLFMEDLYARAMFVERE
jgi:hypothetical protein